MRKKFLVLGLLLCASFASLQWITAGRSHGDKTRNLQQTSALTRVRQAGGGVQARPIDPATRAYKGGWFIGEGQKVAHLADESKEISILALEHPGQEVDEIERWMRGMTDEQIMLKSYDCDRMHLEGMTKVCDVRMRMVVKRSDEKTGKVVFVKPTSDSPLEEQCKAYSDCLAHSAYLGGDVPLAAGLGDELAMHADHRMVPFKGTQEEFQSKIRSTLKELQGDLAKLKADPASQPDDVERLEYLIKFVELRKDDSE